MDPTDAEITDRLRRILQSDEFQPLLAQHVWVWLVERLRTLANWLDQLGPGTRIVLAIAGFGVLAVIGFLLWRSYRETAERQRLAIASGAGDEQTPLSPEVLLRRADSLAEAGRLRDAARALQHALLLQTCRERNLPWRSSLSDWEWVKMLRPPDSVIDVTRTTERIAFGPEPSRAEFDACARGVHTLVVSARHAGAEGS